MKRVLSCHSSLAQAHCLDRSIDVSANPILTPTKEQATDDVSSLEVTEKGRELPFPCSRSLSPLGHHNRYKRSLRRSTQELPEGEFIEAIRLNPVYF